MSNSNNSRVLINVVGVPSIIAVLFLGGPLFTCFITIVMLLAIREIPNLIQNPQINPFYHLLTVAFILLPILYYYRYEYYLEFTILMLISITIIEIFRSPKMPFANISIIMVAFIWIGLMLGSMILLRNYEAGGYNIGFELTFAMMISVWICDTAAFIFGKNFGKKKILPAVSPNKTVVGAIAGLIASFAVMSLLYFTNFSFIGYPSADGFFHGWIDLQDVIVMSLIFGIFGQLGDFGESLLKREAGVKDSSSLLKGHGGILDRFDSLAYTTPLLVIYSKYFIN